MRWRKEKNFTPTHALLANIMVLINRKEINFTNHWKGNHRTETKRQYHPVDVMFIMLSLSPEPE